jgi:hypothetical protein
MMRLRNTAFKHSLSIFLKRITVLFLRKQQHSIYIVEWNPSSYNSYPTTDTVPVYSSCITPTEKIDRNMNETVKLITGKDLLKI